MAEWRKVIVSGSNVELNHISASGNIIPITTDGSSLGSVDQNFSDLFLDSGGVINFDSGNVTITHSSNKLTFNKAIDVDAGVTIDNITIDGTEIDLSSGTLTMDVADDMVIDVDGGNLDVKDNGAPLLNISATDISGSALSTGSFQVVEGVGNSNKFGTTAFSAGITVVSDVVGQANVSSSLTSTGSFGSVIGVGNSNSFGTTTFTSDVSSTGNISGSFTSTGSFGRLETAGDALIKGNLTFGDAATDFVSFGADVTSDFIPNASDSHNLGSNAQRWDTLFLSGSVSASGGDHFINASGASKKVDIDAAGAVQIDAGAASNFTTSDGTLTIEAGGANDKLVLKGDNEDGDAVHIDANADAASILNVDAGILDLDTTGAANIDAGAALSLQGGANSDFTTGGGTITIDGKTGINIAENGTNIITVDNSQNVVVGTVSGKTVTIGHSTSETTVSDNLTVTGNATITGDLDVNGTLTTIDTTNLRVADQFLLVTSGSINNNKDGGLVVQTAANGSGSAFAYDSNKGRWGMSVSGSVGHETTEVVPSQYAVTVDQTSGAPGSNPRHFGTDAGSRRGLIHIDTSTGDIYIYS